MKNFTPQEIVSELDKHIVGQTQAKKAVAIALRNRWRRKQVSEDLQKEIIPKNILMIGPTGIGKTEIARRLAKLDNAPFIKIEATKFTEVGYVGRDVEQIIRDLVENSIYITSNELKQAIIPKAELAAEQRIVNVLCGEKATTETKKKFLEKFRKKELEDKEIEIEIKEKPSPANVFDIPGMPGAAFGMLSLGDMIGGEKVKIKKLPIAKAYKILIEEESEKLLDKDLVISTAIDNVENNGIVFLDEIDKIASSHSDRIGGDVSREGVQRDLLPIVEGTTVTTKYGPIKTDHILFIASGAFHLSKPSDLLPELQGRFPIRVELNPLTKEDLKKILLEPKANLIRQYTEMLATENVKLKFESAAIEEVARLSEEFNQNVENIGARRLHTVIEKILEEINFDAPNRSGKSFTVTKQIVIDKLLEISQNQDLSRFII